MCFLIHFRRCHIFSPLPSPIGLIRRSNKPKSCLTSILRMAPFQALPLLLLVPIPKTHSITEFNEIEDSVEAEGVEDVINYPWASFLHFLALNTYVTNLISRLLMGTSHTSAFFITNSIAAGVLQTFSLDCGQAPFVGLWPLWIFGYCRELVFRLSQMADTFLTRMKSNEHDSDLLYFSPFSDPDEI